MLCGFKVPKNWTLPMSTKLPVPTHRIFISPYVLHVTLKWLKDLLSSNKINAPIRLPKNTQKKIFHKHVLQYFKIIRNTQKERDH
jgi:hypothetical protein